MAVRQTLDLLIGVRILSPQIKLNRMVPSSRGLGRGPLKAKTRVRIPLGPPLKSRSYETSPRVALPCRSDSVVVSRFSTAFLRLSTLRCAYLCAILKSLCPRSVAMV